MCRVNDARRLMDCERHVVAAARKSGARVDPDADPKLATVRPGLAREGLLRQDTTGDRRISRTERHEARVALESVFGRYSIAELADAELEERVAREAASVGG